MEVHFTPEQEEQIERMAREEGKAPERFVQDVLVYCLNDESNFISAVERGLAAAERGEFIEESEMDLRIEKMFSKP